MIFHISSDSSHINADRVTCGKQKLRWWENIRHIWNTWGRVPDELTLWVTVNHLMWHHQHKNIIHFTFNITFYNTETACRLLYLCVWWLAVYLLLIQWITSCVRCCCSYLNYFIKVIWRSVGLCWTVCLLTLFSTGLHPPRGPHGESGEIWEIHHLRHTVSRSSCPHCACVRQINRRYHFSQMILLWISSLISDLCHRFSVRCYRFC